MSGELQQKVLEAKEAGENEAVEEDAAPSLETKQAAPENCEESTAAGSSEKQPAGAGPDDSGLREAADEMSEEKETGAGRQPSPFIGPTRPRSEELTRIHLLGTGNFSSIFLAEEYRSRKVSALKVYSKYEVERRKKTDDILMEKYVLNKLKGCKRVVELYETFKDDLNLYLNMEFLKGGELFDLCAGFGLPSRVETKYFLYKIVLALEEIHQRGIIHRDLKPENIMLVESKTDIKLVDFATSWDFLNPAMKGSGNGSTGRRVYYHFVGTPQYMPPELIRNKGSYEATDVYALGCILYQFVCGFTPFLGPGEYAIFKLSTQPDRFKFYGFFTEEEKELVRRMCHVDHEKRITIQELKCHPYFQDNLPLYQASLDSYQALAALRPPQDAWLLQLRESVLAEVAALFPDQKEPQAQPDAPQPSDKLTKEQLEDLDRPKYISVPGQDSEAPDATIEEQAGGAPDGQEAALKEVALKEAQLKKEKKSLILQRLKEAETAVPEGVYSPSFMKARLSLLQKQLENKTKVKFFEHH